MDEHENFSLENELTELKVQVARVDERLKGVSEKQDCIQERLERALNKMDNHSKAINKFKSDKAWLSTIFGVLYAGMLAWIEYRSK
jgi:chromosome segregation ATPase